MKNKVSISLYEGMELKITVEKGFLIADYSEDKNAIVGDVNTIEEHTIGSIFEYKGKYYLVCEEDVDENNNGGKGCCLSENCAPLDDTKCHCYDRKDAKSVVYKEVKDGDFIIRKYSTENWIVIFKSYRDTKSIQYYAALFSNISFRFNGWCDFNDDFRLATKEEKQQLLDAIHKGGKDWDADNKQIVDYVEPIKVGDLCILWDDYKSDAIIAAVTDVSLNGALPYTIKTDGYKNAIKFISLEQYQQFIKQ